MEALQTRVCIEADVSGSPFEVGLAQGAALREKISHAHQVVDQLEAFRLMKPRWLPYRAFRKLSEKRAFKVLEPSFAADYPDFRRRLEGISQGSGSCIRELYLFSAMESMLSDKRASTTVPPFGACSAIAVRRKRSATGEPVIARNFDYLELVRPLYTLRKTKPSEGYASVEFTMAPFAGAVDGVNERGLCITYNYAYTKDMVHKPSVPLSVVIAETLQRCATASEAAAWIQSRPRWGGGILMIADAEGELMSLELSSTRSMVRVPSSDEDFLFHTNMFSTSEMRAVQIHDDAVYTNKAPEFFRGRRVHESAISRASRLKTLLGETAALDVRGLGAIMADHGPGDEASDTTICVHSPYWSTTASLQLFPRTRRMRVAFESACSAHHEEIAL